MMESNAIEIVNRGENECNAMFREVSSRFIHGSTTIELLDLFERSTTWAGILTGIKDVGVLEDTGSFQSALSRCKDVQRETGNALRRAT